MVGALAAAHHVLDRPDTPTAAGGSDGFVFDYDPDTLADLDHAATGPQR